MASCTEKLMVGVPLLVASGLVFTCPCATLLSCHKEAFLISVAVSIGAYLWVVTH